MTGEIVTMQRSNLTPSHVDQLLFLQRNLEIPDGQLSHMDNDDPTCQVQDVSTLVMRFVEKSFKKKKWQLKLSICTISFFKISKKAPFSLCILKWPPL